ncbi:uncharacterized protein LOC143877870 isoform X2 [Tasmannia lanceolata]|uniref:uncharacterized protein LOC143877870 isoform X2 n=1 Tax=Tasmannia lanceolata TaxID=3420 RepID=UPI004063B0C3
MPGLAHKNAQSGNADSQLSAVRSVPANGIWSKQRGDITFDQLQKFWSELPPHARQELLKIDKQTLFEQARKNLYCSRCNGLLLEGFSQIIMYGKSLQQEGAGGHLPSKAGALKNQIDNGSNIMLSSCQDDAQDPCVHPWGGLAATRDGILTLLDCFLDGQSLKALQNVFDSARARERERELLYPDACGGGGRGWISQGMANYGRGHGTRETCALHTARLSCDTLVDFWSALGDETRHSLLRMKEEDFIERLMYRDCRRNVIREFKELKELKRMRREPRCTNWFCVADTAFQYEVSKDTVQADWHQCFTDAVGAYHHFEWAVGTGEGKSDFLEFEDVGMNGNAQVKGLDLSGLTSCFITLRAWKLDGRCTELSVKAHALKEQPCVHRRLIVGDGFVTITKGESIRRFFEHAEEAEEEEDDDSMDKDGNEPDGDGSRPQKHAKSPELAREFLLDAATVIFKEQVEKAFREGTARQNAHSIFVCLALKLLEERVHVACKEIITLEKQIKLLEEEEREKRDEEERKERRRMKEREKKLRRKERLKGKEREREKKCIESNQVPDASQVSANESSLSAHEEPHNTSNSGDSISEMGDIMLSIPLSSNFFNEQTSNGCINSEKQDLKNDSLHHSCNIDGELSVRDGNGSFMIEESKSSRRKLRFKKESLLEPSYRRFDRSNNATSFRCITGLHRQPRNNATKSNARNCGPNFDEKFHCSNNRIRERYDFHSGYRSRDGQHVSLIRSGRDLKTSNKLESAVNMSRSFYRSSKFSHGSYTPDNCVIPKGKFVTVNNPPSRDVFHGKKVWEPMESRKKCPRSNSDPDITLRSSAFKIDACEEGICDGNLGKADTLNNYEVHEHGMEKSNNRSPSDEVGLSHVISTFPGDKSSDPLISTSSSDNCSSCLSEGDSSTGSKGAQNAESLSTSDSEDASQQSEGRDIATCGENSFHSCLDVDVVDRKYEKNGQESFTRATAGFPPSSCMGVNLPNEQPGKSAHNSDIGKNALDMGSQQNHSLPIHNQSIHLPVFPTPSTMGYYHQSASWEATPTNGLVSFAQPNPYLFTSPLGYGLPANQSSHLCMQYGAMQPLTTPVLNVARVPSYQMANKANVLNPKDQTMSSKSGGGQEATRVPVRGVSEHSLERSPPNQQLAQKEGSPGQDGNIGAPAKYHNDSPNFSLFHFGGPVAVAAGYNLNPASLKDEVIGDFSSKPPLAPVRIDLACSKKETTVEEYSLFAASSGGRFSFF